MARDVPGETLIELRNPVSKLSLIYGFSAEKVLLMCRTERMAVHIADGYARLNNGVLGGYDGYLPISTEKFGTRNLTGRYAALAQALGGYGERIEQAAELGPAMQRAQQEMDNGRAVLLEVMTREESVFARY